MKNAKKRFAGFVLFLLLLTLCFQVSAAAAPGISKTKLSLRTGQSYTLKITGFTGTVKWSSGNRNVAVVSSRGKVTAKKAGTAVITARCGKVRRTCRVTVKPVGLSRTGVKKTEGSVFTIKLLCGKLRYGIDWSISNANALTFVKAQGNSVTLKAGKAGTAVLTCHYHNKTYKCKVTVVKKTVKKKTAAQQQKTPENVIIFG